MLRTFGIVCIVLLAVILIGCSSTGKSLMAKQMWSENYAKEKGVEATSPLMVDGDRSTFGETQLPSDSSTGSTRYTEAVVKLPEPKKIRKIVINSDNLQSFTVYSGGDKPDDWKSLSEIKNIEGGKIEIPVSVTTDRIRIKIDRTSDDTTTPGGRGSQARLKRAPAKIKEIELYGMVEATTPTVPPAVATAGTAVTTSGATPGTSATATSGSATTASTPASKPEVPKGPPVTATLETTQKTFPIAGPIPLKINIKTGADEQTVLDEIMSSKVLSTKLIVKSSTGEIIASSKPTPPLSSPKPKRFVDKPVDVRDAKILDPNSVLAVDVANLLAYYPIKTPGTYTVQLSTWIELNNKFVGREQTQKEDIDAQIREVNSKANYTPEEKAGLIQSLKDDLQQSQKVKAKRYIEANTKGVPFKLESDTIELIVQ